MLRVPVISFEFASVGYDPATRVLEVELPDGSFLPYFGAPEDA